MFRSSLSVAPIVLVAPLVATGAAEAQSLSTCKWPLQPYCNVIVVTITQQGHVYALDGVDDQCGASKPAAPDRTVFLNPAVYRRRVPMLVPRPRAGEATALPHDAPSGASTAR